MEQKKYELELLMEQRREIVSDMGKLTENAAKLLITFLPLVATLIVSYFSVVSKAYAPILRFAVIEAIIILIMIVSACLYAANVDRDYIAAIDEYIFEHYDISVLFFSGILSRKHTTGINGVFPMMTTLIGASAACVLLMVAVWFFRYDSAFYKNNIHLVVFLTAQMAAFGRIILKNDKRKRTAQSEVMNDCLDYLNRRKTSETIK